MVVVVAVALHAASPTTARADARAEARVHYRAGMRRVQAGRYLEGIERLRRAYEVLPHPNVLGNIARAYALAGMLEESIEYFEEYLEWGPPDAAETTLILSELRAALATASGTGRDARTGSTAVDEATPDEIADADVGPPIAREPGRGDSEPASDTTSDSIPPDVATPAAATGPLPEGVSSSLASDPESDLETYTETIDGVARARTSPLDAPAATTIITRQDIRMSGATSISELLRRAPGVTVMTPTPNNANVGIRGFNRLLSPRVMMLINGRPTIVDALGVPYWEAHPIDVEDIERIEVIRGPASAIYGANGFSGVVNVVLRSPGGRTVNEMTGAVGNAANVRAHAAVSGRIRRLAYRMHAGFRQGNRFAMPVSPERLDSGYPLPQPELAFRQAHAGGQIRANVSRSVSSITEFGIARSERLTFYATGAFLEFAGEYLSAFASTTVQGPVGRIRVFGTRDTMDSAVRGIEGITGRFENDVADIEAELHRSFHFLVDHDLHVGGNYRYKQVLWNLIGSGRRHQHHAGLYVEDAIRAGEHVRAVASLRYDYHPQLDRPVLSPRLALLFQPTGARTIRASAGTAFRTPSLMESFVNFPVSTPVTAVAAIAQGTQIAGRRSEPERIESFELGYVDQTSNHLSFEATAYFNRVRGLIGFDDRTRRATLAEYSNGTWGTDGFLTDSNQFVYGTSHVGTEPEHYEVFGAELAVHAYPLTGFDIALAYTTNATRSTTRGRAPTWDLRTSRHMLNVGLQHRFDFGLELGADFHVSSRQVWPELQATSTGVDRALLPIAAYFLLNARVGYRFAEDRFEAALSGFNLTNSHRRLHPFGQALDVRVMASLSIRMGDGAGRAH